MTNARILFYDPKTRIKYTIIKYFIPCSKLEEAWKEGEMRNKFKQWAKRWPIFIFVKVMK